MSKLFGIPAAAARAAGRRAFTLMEMLVSFLMLVILLVAVLVIFERSARIGRDQTEIAAIQQSSRIAHAELLRHVRMAGAGGLPLTWKNLPDVSVAADTLKFDSPGAFPNGFAVAIRNDVPENYTIPASTAGATHTVIPHSDILTLRGAFSVPIYYYYPAVLTNKAGKEWNDGDKEIKERTLEIPNRVGQDFRTSLAPLIDYLTKARAKGGKVLFLVRDLMNPDAYGILRWNPAEGANDLVVKDCETVDKANGMQGAFKVGCIKVRVALDPGTASAKLMLGTALLPSKAADPSTDKSVITLKMTGVPRGKVAFPTQFGSIAVLQEYRYYLRADFEVPGDTSSRLSPVLTRTEFLPTLEVDAKGEDFIESIDVVDNVFDLQVSVGVDQDYLTTDAGHGVVTDSGSSTDEILFNAENDLPGDAKPAGLTRFTALGVDPYVRWFHPKLDVFFLRLTTVAQSPRADRDFVGAGIGWVEDADRTQPFLVAGKSFNYNNDRKYRRRLLQSVAELRNLK